MQEDSDDEALGEAFPVGNSMIEFQYWVKGTLGKRQRCLLVELESQCIILADGRHIPSNCIVNTSKIANTPGGLLISIRLKSKLKEKKWYFKSLEEASLFQMYIAALNTSGSLLSSIFHSLDFSESLNLTSKDLQKCVKFGITLTNAECEGMIDIVSNKKAVDYLEFFNFFMRSQVTGVESCILEWRNQLVDDLKKSTPRASSAVIASLAPQYKSEGTGVLGNDTMPNLVPGEIVLNVCQHVRYTLSPPGLKNPRPPFVGNLFFTSFRLIFSSYIRSQSSVCSRYVNPSYFDEISLPLSTISKIDVLKTSNSSNASACTELYSLAIHCKDLRIIHISFNASDSFTITFSSGLSAHAFPPSPQMFFAFSYKYPTTVDGWNVYDFRKEFLRQKVLNNELWRIWSDNFSLVETYPREFILPAGLSMTDITEAAKFRSRGRIPALTWRNSRTGALLCRSSQPMVGVLGHKSLADKLLLNLYRVRGDVNDVGEIEDPSSFYIMDCRKTIAATANSALGKGVEDEKNYERTKVVFLDIENIHVMRSSLKMVEDALISGGYGSSMDNGDDARFLTKIEASEWLHHSRRILAASVTVAEKLELERASVLVHCSDGWDRTAQVCALVELLLDPYYRTIEGFGVLIEKDWCSFGFKFQDRISHGDSNCENSSERSPVFLQWLDVVHLLLLQFPNQFQFNEQLLVFLADSSYSCQFGNFLGNNEKQRKELECATKTVSIWSYVLNYSQNFSNPLYVLYSGPLWPSLSTHLCRFWERYFLRWEPDMHPRSGSEWKDDWGLSEISTNIGSARHSLNIRGTHRANSEGDSNITRPISVVRGTFSDPFREAMNSINELERQENESTSRAHQEHHHHLKPTVSFESIYPENGDDADTFSHTHHTHASFRPKPKEDEKTGHHRGHTSGNTKEKLRFQAL